MLKCPIINEKFLIVQIDNLNALITTGINTSISNKQYISILNKRHSLVNNFTGIRADSVSKWTNEKIDIIIGSDILVNYKVEINWTEKFIILSDNNKKFSGYEIDLITFMDIPSVKLKLDDIDIEGIIDTGFQYSYFNKRFFEKTGSKPFTDIYPLMGSFDSKITKLEIIFANQTSEIEFGLLPSSLQRIKNLTKKKAILGLNLFKKYQICLDYPNKKLIVK